MSTISLTLPDPLKEFVEARAAERGFADAGEYVQELIRLERERCAKERLEELLIEGLNSGEPIPINDEWFEKKRARLLASHSQSSG